MSARLAALCLVAFLCIAGTFAYTQSAPPPATPKNRTTEAAAAQAKAGMVKPPATAAEKIASAMSAAPMAIAKDAAILDVGMDANKKMKMTTLRAGTNGWTCIPDGPSPGVDPMCVDKNGGDWMNAWMNHTPPPPGKLAIGYMLMGGSDASNTDPFATEPKPGAKWIDTGPHMMVMNIENHFDGYPTAATNTKAPYVMFAGTPYAHLMIPVK